MQPRDQVPRRQHVVSLVDPAFSLQRLLQVRFTRVVSGIHKRVKVVEPRLHKCFHCRVIALPRFCHGVVRVIGEVLASSGLDFVVYSLDLQGGIEAEWGTHFVRSVSYFPLELLVQRPQRDRVTYPLLLLGCMQAVSVVSWRPVQDTVT